MFNYRFHIVDIETTDMDADAEIVEFAVYGLNDAHNRPIALADALCRNANKPISNEAAAIHHITAAIVLNYPVFRNQFAEYRKRIDKPDYYVAHNSAFEEQYFPTDGIPWICTYKCAMRAWPELGSFSNQYLRYALGIDRTLSDVERRFANTVHRAAPDAYITALIFQRLISKHTIEELVEWSADIAIPPRIMFGKHRGKNWQEIEQGYLNWILNKSDLDGDTKELARREIVRRQG